MNTELRDPLDDQLRTLMRTAVRDAANPPTVADIERGAFVGLAPPTEVRHSARWVAIAAVMLLALGCGIVWSLRVENPTKPANQPNPVDDRPGLGVYVLPTTLPEGWRLVDITESAADNTGAVSPRQWIIESRDASGRAVLDIYPASVATAGTSEVTVTTASSLGAGANWSTEAAGPLGMLSWTEQDHSVTLWVQGFDEEGARSIRAALQPDTENGELKYALPAESPYRVVDDLGPAPLSDVGVATLTFIDEQDVVVSVNVSANSEHDIDVLLDPSIVGASPIVRPYEDGPTVAKIVRTDFRATLTEPLSPNPVRVDYIAAVLRSLATVDYGAWVAAAAAADASVAALPLVGSAPIVGGELSLHRDDGLTSLCVTRDGGQGCMAAVTQAFGRTGAALSDLSVSLLVGGAWVVVQGVNEQDAAGPVEVDVAGVQSEIVSTEVGSFAVMIVPSGVDQIRFSIGVQGQRSIADARAVRPIR